VPRPVCTEHRLGCLKSRHKTFDSPGRDSINVPFQVSLKEESPSELDPGIKGGGRVGHVISPQFAVHVPVYEGGPKNNRNRPVAHACFLVTSCAAR
jgi:hypothetical protein